MKNTIKKEIKEFAQDYINEQVNYDKNYLSKDAYDIHHEMFNQDYYIIGHYEAEQWLKKHDIGVFEAIEICNEYEENNFGEIHTKFDNAEKLVNHLVYWYGQEVLTEIL